MAIATFFVYLPVRNHDFITYDDDTYVTNNRDVQSGLSWRSVQWAFTAGHTGNWHPVTWLSHMLDCELFGLRAYPDNPAQRYVMTAQTR